MDESRGHKTQDAAQAGETPSVCAEMRAVPSYDHDTGRLTGVTLTRRPPRQGAGLSFPTERPDLDRVIPSLLPGWHWFEDRDDILCELAPTAEDVLAQIADDIIRERLDGYRLLGDEPPAEQLREAATRRMSLPAHEAPFQCARLLRDYEEHLRRIEADDED